MAGGGERRLCALALALTLPLAAAAGVPSEAELEAARPGVEALTEPEYAALRAGTMGHPEVAVALRRHAEGVGTEAARFLLERAALRQYSLGGDVAGAEEVYERALASRGLDCALALARFSSQQLNRLASSRVPGARQFVDRLAADDRLSRSIADFRSKLDAAPEDAAVRHRLAAALAAAGDAGAAEEYARSGVEDAQRIFAFERDYPLTGLSRMTSARVAEFWRGEAQREASSSPEVTRVLAARAERWQAIAVSNGVVRATAGKERR